MSTISSPLGGAPSRIYTAERLEIEYSPAKWHADRAATLARHHDLGLHAIQDCQPTLDLRYGPGQLQTLDLFPSANRSGACCVILHGGFWRTSDKAAMHFIAGALSRQGTSCVVPNFDLCPAVSIPDIVRQVGEAVTWTACHASTFADENRGIFILGHATGAHLGAMLLTQAGPIANAAWLQRIAGTLLISGLYDLRCVPDLVVNKVLQLDAPTAVRMSPLLSTFVVRTPLTIASAQTETQEFQAQSADLTRAAREQGLRVESFCVADVGHFSILDRILHPNEPYIAEFLKSMSLERPRQSF
jgi:arylformamidase